MYVYVNVMNFENDVGIENINENKDAIYYIMFKIK